MIDGISGLLRLLLEVPGSLLEAEVALLIGPPGTKANANEGRPRPPAEEEDREDDTEAEAESRLNEHVGKAAVPLDEQGFQISQGPGYIFITAGYACRQLGRVKQSHRHHAIT